MRTAVLTIGQQADIQFLIELARKMGIEILTLSPKGTTYQKRFLPNELIEAVSFSKFLG